MSKLKCCDGGCCLTADQLPTSITLHCEGVDYLLTMGSWTPYGSIGCCWVAESDPVSVPDLTDIELMELVQSYYSAATTYYDLAIIDRLQYPQVSFCGEIVPSPDRPRWLTRTVHSEYLHEIFLKYVCKEMNVRVYISRNEMNCVSLPTESCKWLIKVEFIGRNTTGPNANDVRNLGRRFGQTTHDTHYTHPLMGYCTELNDPFPTVKDWTASNYDDTTEPPTSSPELKFSRGTAVEDGDPIDEIEFDVGETYNCSAMCSPWPSDEEIYAPIDPEPANSGWVDSHGNIFFGTPPPDVLTPDPPNPWPVENARIRPLPGGGFNLCGVFGEVYFGGPFDPAKPCEFGNTGRRFSSAFAGEGSYRVYRKNELIGDAHYAIVRPKFSLKFVWP